MNENQRKERLSEIKSRQSAIAMTGLPLRFQGKNLTENAYRIPLEYLIYNKYNGRIGAAVKSYEIQNCELNPENEKDFCIIEDFLFQSKIDRNKKTMDSLKREGQLRYGIVTASGVIIDGNRRAMALNRLYRQRDEHRLTPQEAESCRYFLAIILPVDATPRDIQMLETTYQMGEDDKLDYNPIEKYLKCKELKHWFKEKEIAQFMGEREATIKEWLSILTLMDEYLDSYGYSGIYTRLEKTEGQFVDLQKYLESYKARGANTRTVNWTYSDSDISDLTVVCFDYIRARYEGKEFREIARTGKDGCIFAYQELWNQFLNKHKELPQDEKTVEELRAGDSDADLSTLLKARDNDWTHRMNGMLTGNLKRFVSKVEDKRTSSKPAELIEKALNALQTIDTDQESFYSDPVIFDKIKEINTLVWEMKKSLERTR